MRNLSWVVTVIAACVAALTLLGAFVANSSPQQAALAAIAVGIAVIPYVFSRAIETLGQHGERPKSAIISLSIVKCAETDQNAWNNARRDHVVAGTLQSNGVLLVRAAGGLLGQVTGAREMGFFADVYGPPVIVLKANGGKGKSAIYGEAIFTAR